MKTQKNKNIIIGLLVVWAIGAVLLFLYLEGDRTKVGELRHTLTNLRQEASEMATLQQKYDELSPALEKINRVLPEKAIDIASFLQEVNAAGKSSEITLTIEVSDPELAKAGPDGALVEVNLDILGSYVNTTKFLNKISRLPYYFVVETLDTRPGQQAESGLRTFVRIGLTTSYSLEQ